MTTIRINTLPTGTRMILSNGGWASAPGPDPTQDQIDYLFDWGKLILKHLGPTAEFVEEIQLGIGQAQLAARPSFNYPRVIFKGAIADITPQAYGNTLEERVIALVKEIRHALQEQSRLLQEQSKKIQKAARPFRVAKEA